MKYFSRRKMSINMRVGLSVWRRLLSSLLLGKYINKELWLKTVSNQYHKGVNKYGHTLDDCDPDKFDWKIMAVEELVDFWNYKAKIKQNERVN